MCSFRDFAPFFNFSSDPGKLSANSDFSFSPAACVRRSPWYSVSLDTLASLVVNAPGGPLGQAPVPVAVAAAGYGLRSFDRSSVSGILIESAKGPRRYAKRHRCRDNRMLRRERDE